jgi:galactose oxidase
MMKGMEMPTKASKVSYASTLKPLGWVAKASSTARGHSAQAVLSSRKSRFWESAPLRARTRLPQSLTVKFPKPVLVSGMTYVPHGTHDVIGRFVVRLSSNGTTFGPPVAYGTWQANKFLKRVGWVPRQVRAVRITVKSLSSSRDHAVEISRLIFSGAERDQSESVKEIAALAGAASKATATSASATATASATAAASTTAAASASAAASTTASTSPSVIGEWGPTIAFPLIPVAAALIPGDKLLVWSADSETNYDSSDDEQYTQTAILNLATGAVTAATVSNTAHDMFCPGASILPNGDVIVTGGIGNTDTSIYSPYTNTWTTGPQMNIGRGYQGQTTLADGQAFVLGGSWSGPSVDKLGEVYSPSAGWRELTQVPATPIDTDDAQGVYRADNHGWFIATSGDRVFQAGPSAEMHWISTTGSGSITDAGPRGTSGDEMNGNAVLYDVNKIFTVGGAPDYQDSNATNVANIVNISSNTPTVTPTASMSYSRAFANSVVLPTGKIFTVGGESYAVPFSDETADLYPEMWDPTTGQWTVMAEEAEPRTYHSVAVLLPDGTVFSGGGGLCGTCSTNHPDGQIFYPPYLFNSDGSLATRPVISSAPSSAQTGQTITVTTAGPVQSFDLIRYGEATHTVDNDQRRIPLSIVSSSGDTYTLTIPSDPGVALPGPYMLFAINASGVPSVSATIMVTTPATSTPSSAYGKRIAADGPAVYWPLSDASGSGSAADLSGNRDTGVFSSTGITYQSPSPVEGSSGQGITLNGGSVVQSQPQDTPSSYSEELWFKTTSTSGGNLATYGNSAGGTASNSAQDRSIYLTAAGNIEFGTWPEQTIAIESPGSYNNGQWHFVVATQGSDGMHLYVDGKLVASNTTSGAQPYTGYWQLGGTTNSGWPNRTTGAFTGSISDAALFDQELTAAQIQAEYQASPAATATSTTTTPTPTNAYQTKVDATGPSAYWPLSDASGSVAADASGNGSTGVYSSTGVTYGVASPVEGAGGTGVTLAATGQVVSAHAVTTPTTYSEALWFKTTSTTGGNLATFGSSANGTASNTAQDRSIYLTTAGNLAFGTWPQQVVTIQSPSTYNNGQWHFVVATQGTDGMHLYVDGQLVASNTTSGAQPYTGYWQLGGITNGGWTNRGTGAFTGSISDAALYLSTELTAAQVSTLYGAG